MYTSKHIAIRSHGGESLQMIDTPLQVKTECAKVFDTTSGIFEDKSFQGLDVPPQVMVQFTEVDDTTLGAMEESSQVKNGPSQVMEGFLGVNMESSVIFDISPRIVDTSSGVLEESSEAIDTSSGVTENYSENMDLISIKEEPLEDIGYEEMDPVRDENTTKKRFPCPECGKGFDFKAHLRKHSRVHTGETPFICTICKKGFKHVSHLRRHRNTHSTERDICDICGKGFYEIGQHMKTHIKKTKLVTTSFDEKSKVTIEIPDRVQCPFCTKNYAHKRHLKRHLLTHQNFKPYSCEFCDKRFYQSCDLNVHRRIHLDIKPYSCEKCNKQFRTSSSLKKHARLSCTEKIKKNVSHMNDSNLICEENEIIQKEEHQSDLD